MMPSSERETSRAVSAARNRARNSSLSRSSSRKRTPSQKRALKGMQFPPAPSKEIFRPAGEGRAQQDARREASRDRRVIVQGPISRLPRSGGLSPPYSVPIPGRQSLRKRPPRKRTRKRPPRGRGGRTVR